jgi:hypothetical protein
MIVPLVSTATDREGMTPYVGTTIAQILQELNKTLFIPDIQRSFEWNKDKIIRLFDSILRGYPINTFLFWHVERENRENWHAYRFVEDHKENMPHSTLAHPETIQDLTLVLDGQQRLTSFLIGLKGVYRIRPRGTWYGIESNWIAHRLYINLLHNPERVDYDAGDVMVYSLDFLAESKALYRGPDKYWFKVPRILYFTDMPTFQALLQQELQSITAAVPSATDQDLERASETLTKLYRSIWHDQTISYLREEKQDHDRALTIFLRTNHAGKPLTKSTLMFSIITARWSTKSNIDLRGQLIEFVEGLNTELGGKPRISIDFVMKTSLALTDLPVQYKVDNFTNANIDHIYDRWEQIKKSIHTTLKLVRSFGLNGDTLASVNALIPITYYIYKRPKLNVFGTRIDEVHIAKRIRYWLLCALLSRAFGAHSDSILLNARMVLQQPSGEADFPVEDLNRQLVTFGAVSNVNEAVINTVLATTLSSAFVPLALLYDQKNWGNMIWHVDHIFPKDRLQQKTLAENGIASDKIARYSQLRDSICNLELLTERENTQKQDKLFESWIKTRSEEFKDEHLIPKDDTLYTLDRFEEFIAERSMLIRQRLEAMLAPGSRANPHEERSGGL